MWVCQFAGNYNSVRASEMKGYHVLVLLALRFTSPEKLRIEFMTLLHELNKDFLNFLVVIEHRVPEQSEIGCYVLQ